MELYARGILLRNCGRFLHVASDFGSDYKTHPFLSSEMLYAGLSRERTRVPRSFNDAMSSYRFLTDFLVQDWPVWFTTAMLVNEQTGDAVGKPRQDTDTHLFNSIKEGQPGIQENPRLPKFGSMETILPDRRFLTFALSPEPDILASFDLNQVYWMGKKRTMFQICRLTEIAKGEYKDEPCFTPFLQVEPTQALRFQRFEIVAGAQRYVVLAGETRVEPHWKFPFGSDGIFQSTAIPIFAIEGFLSSIAV